MSAKTHPCPKCGGMMDYRLGEYQCQSCDYSEPAGAQPKEERGTDVGQRREGWQPGVGSTLINSRSSYTGKLITPPEAGSSQAAASRPNLAGYEAPLPPPPPSGSLYSQSEWERGSDSLSDRGFIGDGLATEKRIFFIIYAALQGLAIVVMLLLATIGRSFINSMAGAGGQSLSGQSAEVMALLPMIVAMYVIAILIAVAVTWWALFGTEAAVKWCCMGCLALGLLLSLGQLIQVVAPSALLVASGPSHLLGGASAAIIVTSVVIQVGWQVWFMSILYRDVQQRQYR